MKCKNQKWHVYQNIKMHGIQYSLFFSLIFVWIILSFQSPDLLVTQISFSDTSAVDVLHR